MLSKTELRRRLLHKRARNPDKDRLILQNLYTLSEFEKAALILTYISTDTEINTHSLLESNKSLAIPRVNGDKIEFYIIKSLRDMQKGIFGISEPLKSCKKAQINNNTFCVVPSLACDRKGHRLGYGGGYYDRFLSGFTGISAVLCYSQNIIALPVQEHDIKCDYVITEGGILLGG